VNGCRWLVVLAAALALAGVGCDSGSDPFTDDEWWTPFIEPVREAPCADIRNRMFVIDDRLVFTDQVGSCADARFAQILYGETIDNVKCVNADSIGGPIRQCFDAAYEDEFLTMIDHLFEPDLGLGPSHTVWQIPL